MSLQLSRAVWMARRLAAMSGAEIAHRVAEQAKRQASKRGLAEPPCLPCLDNPDQTPVLPRLPLDLDATRLVETDGAMRSRWRRAADRLAQGSYSALGIDWPVSAGTVDWHLDPVSGRRWPSKPFCFDVPHRHAVGYGDVKYVWEINRLQHLQPVAALAWLEHDESLARLCCTQIESWIDSNPPFMGINWTSNIEAGLRVISLLIVCTFIGNSIKPSLARKITESLGAHAYWLRRFPSRFSSANNHLIAEAAATFVLASVWPDLPDAIAERNSARQTLIDEVERQILADGVGAEQSPTYTSFTLEFYLLSAWTADRLGDPFPDSVTRHLARAGEFLFWITDKHSNQPRIGDDDEGRVIFDSEGREADYVSSVLGSLAILTRRPDFAPPANAPRLRNVFFGSPPAPAASPEGGRSFPVGGYSVLHRQMGSHSAMLVFDHGPLGYLSIAAHGHADALAIWLHIDGVPVLVDAGTYLYHAGGRWRDHFRGTPAHNTVELNGQDSSKIAGSFNWAFKAQAHLNRMSSGARDEIEAEHDGYQKHFGVLHRRRIALYGRTLEIEDNLIGRIQAPMSATVSFLVNPALDVIANEQGVLIRGSGIPPMQITAVSPALIEVVTGQDDPLRGWYSPRFGERGPAPLIRITPTSQASGDPIVSRLEVLEPTIFEPTIVDPSIVDPTIIDPGPTTSIRNP